MKNKWKAAFFSLLALVIIIIVIAAGFFFSFLAIGGETQNIHNDAKKYSRPIFTVQADKDQLDNLVNNEIQKHQTGNLTYYVNMDKDVQVNGSLGVLGTSMPFSISFDPVVKNGDVILKEKKVKLGKFNLPDKQVLKFINFGTKLPDWVIVQPDKRQIYINVTKIPLNKDIDFYLKAKQIQLSKNKIVFELHQK
ncbi:YpmS family protein [Scopulibacillus cellulosilyticus]|uniref:YpmS family protein n=1 Tax=Scopulibacillus cellulosilyticus TaxID=2665665 RepID=A0ABW2PT15_9BACL